MYSIFFLGFIMIADSFGLEIPTWLSPLTAVATSMWPSWFQEALRQASMR